MASVQHCVTSEDHIQLEHRASDIHTQQETKVTVTGIGLQEVISELLFKWKGSKSIYKYGSLWDHKTNITEEKALQVLKVQYLRILVFNIQKLKYCVSCSRDFYLS